MNPYLAFTDLLFTVVDAPPADVVDTMLAGLNEPVESDVERALRTGSREVEVIEDGVPKIYRAGDPLPPKDVSTRYCAKKIPIDFSLAYIDKAAVCSTALRVVLWEPRIHSGKTVFMTNHDDAMCYSVFRLSEDSPYNWVNVRIYDDLEYPGCFFDYYAEHRKVLRRVMACKNEEGWEFSQEGPVQPFENLAYYTTRLKKDRLTKEIITEYLHNLGFMIRQDGFWETDKPAQFLWQERRG